MKDMKPDHDVISEEEGYKTPMPITLIGSTDWENQEIEVLYYRDSYSITYDMGYENPETKENSKSTYFETPVESVKTPTRRDMNF